MKLYLHHLQHLPIVRNNVADPFRAEQGRALPRPEVLASGVSLCERVEDADICGFPAHWHAYTGDLRRAALSFLDAMRSRGLRVVVWVNGDDEIDVPFANSVVFQHAFRRTRRRRNEIRVYPPFDEDPLAELYGGDLAIRAKGPRPVVGFCGQAKVVAADEARRLVVKSLARVRSIAGRSDAVPEPWPSHVRLRQQVLRSLANDPRVTSNFVIRERYRGGLVTKEDRRDPTQPTRTEFLENLRGSDYTVCIRGGGNFSVRLFETLSFGRLPLVVDTDSVLPWPADPFWSQSAVIVDGDDLSGVGSALVGHFHGLDDEAFEAHQYAARAFWLDRLSLPGYFSHFRELLEPR